MSYAPSPVRYESSSYRRSGRSGLVLPVVSLGLWQNFWGVETLGTQRAILRRAFDRGVTHFDLANNYGPPYGAAEENFGRIFRSDFKPYRDELVISSKAGGKVRPGPYGEWGSRKCMLASLDQSLKHMGLDHVDIFYSHWMDPNTPLEETMGALDSAVRAGKAIYVGLSSYSPDSTRKAAAILRSLGTPCTIHQPSYSMLNRWIEQGLLATLADLGIGCAGFSVLAWGDFPNKYLANVATNSRGSTGGSGAVLKPEFPAFEDLQHVQSLAGLARERGQSLAQMAIAWTLRDARVTSALVGARTLAQLDDSLDACENLEFTTAELVEIDKHTVEVGSNLWAQFSNAVAS